MFAMSRQLKGALMAAGGGVCWGISGTMGQYLFTHEAMQTTWLIPIRLSLAGLILFVYWLVKDRRLLFAPWRQRDSAVMLVLYGVFGISLSQFLYFLTLIDVLILSSIRADSQIFDSQVYADSVIIKCFPAVRKFYTYTDPPVQSVKGYSRIHIFNICWNTSMFCKSYPIHFLLICFPAGRKAFKLNVGITELYLNIVLIELRH